MENHNYCGYVYLTENLINGKKYVGKRQKPYFDHSYVGSGAIIEKAIKKYGLENFKCSVIEWCSNKEELSDREEYWISFYNAVEDPNFYNITPLSTGLPSGFKYSEEIKQKMRKPKPTLQGKERSQEIKDKISKNTKGKPKYSLRGVEFSIERKQKISEATKGKLKPGVSISNSKRLKGVPRSEESILKQKETISKDSDWGSHMRGKTQSDFQKSQMSKARVGYIRSEEEIKKMKDTISKTNKVQNLSTGEVFGNSSEAEKFYGTGKENNGLLEAIKNHNKYRGFFWTYLGDSPPLNEEQRLNLISTIEQERASRPKNYKRRKIICLSTGEIFDSIKSACIKYDVKYTNLKDMKKYHACGMEWDEYNE